MSTEHTMKLLAVSTQTDEDESFVGGKPSLPRGTPVPKCRVCSSEQTFFMQIAFPQDHIWSGFTLAICACTRCAREDLLIPEMLSGALKGANVSAAFLREYQRNFGFLVFPTRAGCIADGYRQSLKFRKIRYDAADGARIGHVGGSPQWLLDDEAPSTYDSSEPMQFLLQLDMGLTFECTAGASAQIEPGLTGRPEASANDFYTLFIGNAAYLFGATSPRQNGVYAVTQVT